MHCAVIAAFAIILLAWPAFAQCFDATAQAKWSRVEVFHFEAVGEIAGKHVQIPPSTPGSPFQVSPGGAWIWAFTPTVKVDKQDRTT